MNNKKSYLKKEIYKELFNRIVSGRYSADTWLREETLSKEFNVSRTPMRTILHQLEMDGLVEIIPKHGVKVYSFNADDVDEIFEIRKAIELIALKIAAPNLSIDKLGEIIVKINGISESDDYKEHARVDAMIHQYFVSASGRRRIIKILDRLFRLTENLRELGFKDENVRKTATEEHLELMNALLARDVGSAEEILEKHLQSSKIRMLSRIIKGDLKKN